MQLSLLFDGPIAQEPPSSPVNKPPSPPEVPPHVEPTPRRSNQNRNQNPKNQNQKNENPKNQNPERRTPNPEPVLVRNSRARRYVLRVTAEGTVRVTMPRWGSRREALEFATSQRAWVERQLRKVAEDRERPRPPELSREELRALVARARRELPPRLLELAAQYGLAVSRISIRNQRWRWGSCN